MSSIENGSAGGNPNGASATYSPTEGTEVETGLVSA